MARAWRPIADLDTQTTIGSQIQHILSTGNFDHLAHHALQIRAATDARLTATFDFSRFASGRKNLVLDLRFSDNVSWIVRVPLEVDDDTSTSMLSEVTSMRLVQRRTTIPVARIFAFETTSGIFGFPYILMEHLPGNNTRKGLSVAVPVAFHSKVAKQIANVLVELSKLVFDEIGRLIATAEDDSITVVPSDPTTTVMKSSLDYFYGIRYQENVEISEEHQYDKQWITASWALTAALAYTVMPDRINGPFPLCHMDLYWGNILFDDEYNITGIIDWSGAQTAPLEQLSAIPDFMLFMGSAESRVTDAEFKNFLVKAVADLEGSQASGTKLSSYLASSASEVYACQYGNSARHALSTAEEIADIMYNGSVTWEQLVAIYGTLPIPGVVNEEHTEIGQ